MRQDVLEIPNHLLDALWRVETAQLQGGESSAFLVCGAGGSAIGGDLAAAVLGDRLTRPMVTVRDYDLPAWVDGQVGVLCSSFSGTTEETLATFAAAGDAGCRRIVASTGGPLTEAARADKVPVIGLPGILPAPRAAVAYMVVVALEVAARCGVAPRLASEIEEAAAELEELSEALAIEAAEIAALVGDRMPVIYGAGLTAPVARRWKAQINENVKRPAFFSTLPEASHNEICAWGIDHEPPVGPAQAAIFLGDVDQHPRIHLRSQLMGELMADADNPVYRCQARGKSRTARLMSAVMLGDLLSLELAQRDGVDPLPIAAIDRLKEKLT